MSCPIGADEINKLKLFIGFCSQNPAILNLPQLEFFKVFVEKLGGKVPAAEPDLSFSSKPESAPKEPEVESDPESDIDIDNEGCVEPDNDPPQSMGDPTKTPTEEELDQASALRSEAASHFSDQRYEEAVATYEKAINLNPINALFHAKRGQAYLKLNKPNACIRDCNRALELNCDSAAAYKYRGRAHRLLGNWELAAKDLRQACNIDFDEEADEWLREVQPNAKKLQAHKVKQDRKKAEKAERERLERIRRAQEANKKAAEEQKRQQEHTFDQEEDGNDNFSQADLLNAFKDPEVASAFQDIMSNPANVVKYQSNPKIMKIITKVGSAMGKGGAGAGFPGAGFPGAGFPGAGFPGAGSSASNGGFPNFTTPPPSNPSKPDLHDDGLD